MKRKSHLTVLAVLSMAAMGNAQAAKIAENDALAVTAAKIDMTQAVAAAEQHVGGKASRAEYERHKGQWMFDVEVIKDKKVMDVKVDPTSGKVIASTEDKTDRDDEHDKPD
ncbi:MAG: PepSY domain-containing protein [Pseudomonadota bacterium]